MGPTARLVSLVAAIAVAGLSSALAVCVAGVPTRKHLNPPHTDDERYDLRPRGDDHERAAATLV